MSISSSVISRRAGFSAWLCLALVVLATSFAVRASDPPHASDCRYVDLGLAYLPSDSFRYGRYAGSAEGLRGVADLQLCRADDLDSSGKPVWRLRGRDLGLASHEVQASIIQQGRYRVWADYQRLPTARGTATTPMLGVGSAALSLPGNWIAAPNTAGLSALLPSLGEVRLGSVRQGGGVGAAIWMPEAWKLEAKLRHERKQGLRSIAGLIGNSGGNPRVATLPEPIDQSTRLFDFSLSHAGKRLQLRSAVHVSHFDNAYGSLSWQNPFAAISGWAPSAGFPSGRGQLALSPDNRFHQFSLGLGYALTPTTRMNLDVATGRMRQNQQFLPFTVNPDLAASIVDPLPRTSLDGRIDTRLLVFRLASRPVAAWNWTLDYRFDERDNRTPRDAYVGIGGDSQLQDASDASSRRRINLPVGYREQRLGLASGYRFGPLADLRVGIERRAIDRTWSARSDSDETRLSLGLRSRLGERLSAGLRWVGSRRSGSTYLGNRPFLDSHTPEYTDTVPGGFENLPGLRQYHLADRDRSQLALVGSFAPSEILTLSASLGRTADDYRRSEFGLVRSRIRNAHLDAALHPATGWSLHGFVGREWMVFDQSARAFQGGTNRLQQAGDPARNWFAEHDDRVDSAGVGLARDLANGVVTLRADYVLTRARGSVQVRTGPALSSAPLPETESRIGTFDLFSEFRLSGRTSLRLGYRHEIFNSADFALDGIGPNTLANVILLGQNSPDYRAHALLISLRHQF